MSESVQSDQNSFFVCCLLVISLFLSACNTETSVRDLPDNLTSDDDPVEVEDSGEDSGPTSPSMDEAGVAVDTTLRLRLDSGDDLDSMIMTVVETRPDSNAQVIELPGAWSYSDTLEAAIYTFTNNLSPGSIYQITLDNVSSDTGNTTVIYEFTTAEDLSIVSQPQNESLSEGSNLSLSVGASGASGISYQWYKDGVSLSNETSAELTISNAAVSDSGQYHVVILSSDDVVQSAIAIVTVTAVSQPESPMITMAPQNNTAVVGGPAFLQVFASGSGPLTYQWFKDGIELTSNTQNFITFTEAELDDAGVYYARVSNEAGHVNSPTAVVTVLRAATIVSDPPASETVFQGESVVLGVLASGDSITYQWRKDGVAISGANNSIYQINNMAADDEGDYDVVVSNTVSSDTSTTVAVSLLSPVSISEHPSALVSSLGGNATFSVTATGSGLLTYQWRKDGIPISGATNVNLFLQDIVLGDAAQYDVVITNGGGSVTSNAASLTVTQGPASVTTHPESQTAYTQRSFTLEVVAAGTAPISYQWLKDGVSLSGQTSSSLTINNVAFADAGSYTVRVSNAENSSGTVSNAAVVSVLESIDITSQPQGVSVYEGESAQFSVTAVGDSLDYQWRKDGVDISGATSSTYSIAAVELSDAASYDVVVSSGGSNETSEAVALVVNELVSITVQPESASRSFGSSVTLSVVAAGTGPISYQWRLDGVDISGATGANLNLNSLDSDDQGDYTVLVFNGGGNLLSNVATLTVNSDPAEIDSHPQNTSVYVGQAINLSATASGNAPILYQWFKDGSELSGETSASLTIASAQLSDAGDYSLRASNIEAADMSNIAEVQVFRNVQITDHPDDTEASSGENVTFSVVSQGDNLAYQWRFNGSDISGANSASYTVTSVDSGDAGSYDVVVSNGGGQETSNSATLTVTAAVANVCTPAAHSGSTYYVATNGSDSGNDGSESEPFATITHALNMADDGALILVKPGTYNGEQRIDGTFTEGVTVRSVVPYQAQLRNNGQVLKIYAPSVGITLEGFDIAHSSAGGAVVIMFNGSGSKTQVDVRNITLRNNIIHDSYNNDLIKLSNSTQNIRIERNMFYNQSASDEHIDVNSSHDIEVVGNIFFNDFAASGRSDPGDTSSFVTSKDSNGDDDYFQGNQNTNLRQNIFMNWQGTNAHGFILFGEDGSSFFEVDGAVVENNLLLGNSDDYMRSPFGVKGSRNITFRNNTVVGDLPGNAFATRLNVEGANQDPENIFFYNNIWSDPTGSMNDFSDTEFGQVGYFEIDNNVYWNNGSTVPNMDCCDDVNPNDDDNAIYGDPQLPDNSGLQTPVWQSGSSQFADGSSTICEVFENLVENYGVPGATSVVLGNADSDNAPSVDILGNTRSASPDIGAVERQ